MSGLLRWGGWMSRRVHGEISDPAHQFCRYIVAIKRLPHVPSRASFDNYLGMIETDISGPAMPSPQASLGRLQRSRRRLRSQRHELMVAFRVINSIEQEMVETEWERWLHEESAKCGQIDTFIRQNRTESSHNDGDILYWSKVRLWHNTYCGSCSREKESWEAAQVE